MSGPATAGAIPPAIHDLGTTVLAQGSHSTGPAPAGRTGPMSWSWMHYLNSVSAADLIRSPLSLLFSGLSGYCLNVVERHVYAADVLVRCSVDRDGFR
jgi:hypothetical protein